MNVSRHKATCSLTLYFLLFFIIISSASAAQNIYDARQDTIPRDSLLYGNFGFSFGHDDRIGGQAGLSYAAKRVHTFRAMYLFSKEVSIAEKTVLDRIVRTHSLQLAYGYVMDRRHLRVMPTAGLAIGLSKFRTRDVDTLVTNSGWYTINTPRYNYDHYVDAGITFSIAYMYAGRTVGVSAEPYVTLKRNVEAGITFNLLVGRLY